MRPAIESQSIAVIKTFQEEKLKEQLALLQEKSPFYKGHFRKNNVDITKIKVLEDLPASRLQPKMICNSKTRTSSVFRETKSSITSLLQAPWVTP